MREKFHASGRDQVLDATKSRRLGLTVWTATGGSSRPGVWSGTPRPPGGDIGCAQALEALSFQVIRSGPRCWPGRHSLTTSPSRSEKALRPWWSRPGVGRTAGGSDALPGDQIRALMLARVPRVEGLEGHRNQQPPGGMVRDATASRRRHRLRSGVGSAPAASQALRHQANRSGAGLVTGEGQICRHSAHGVISAKGNGCVKNSTHREETKSSMLPRQGVSDSRPGGDRRGPGGHGRALEALSFQVIRSGPPSRRATASGAPGAPILTRRMDSTRPATQLPRCG